MKKRLLFFITLIMVWCLFVACGNDKQVSLETNISSNDIASSTEPLSDTESEVIEPVSLVSLKIVDTDVKTSYMLNEHPDFSELDIICCYSDGSEQVLTSEDVEIEIPDMSTAGQKEVSVFYDGLVEVFFIEVSNEEALSVPETKYSSTSLNLRMGPSTDFEIGERASLNDELTVIGRCADGWAKVIFNGSEYYCSEKYLSNEKIEVIVPTTDMTGLIFDGNVSIECQNKAIELYSVVPQNVKNAINNSGFKVIVSTSPAYTEGHAGLYHPVDCSCCGDSHVIGIYAASVGKVNMAVIHEIGHFIDNYVGLRDGYGWNEFYPGVSSTSEWTSIYEEEVAISGFPSWATDNRVDYFAEVVWKALVNPGWCQQTIPRSYDYVVRYINAC